MAYKVIIKYQSQQHKTNIKEKITINIFIKIQNIKYLRTHFTTYRQNLWVETLKSQGKKLNNYINEEVYHCHRSEDTLLRCQFFQILWNPNKDSRRLFWAEKLNTFNCI